MLEVVLSSLVCLALGKFMGDVQYRQIYTFIFPSRKYRMGGSRLNGFLAN